MTWKITVLENICVNSVKILLLFTCIYISKISLKSVTEKCKPPV